MQQVVVIVKKDHPRVAKVISGRLCAAHLVLWHFYKNHIKYHRTFSSTKGRAPISMTIDFALYDSLD